MKNATLILIVAVALCGCASTNGDSYLFRVGDGDSLVHPWKETAANDGEASSGGYIWKGDTVSITLDHAFFRYLYDIGNSSEVVAILEFDEGLGEDRIVTKIVGPLNRVSDGTWAASRQNVVYGPKKVEGSKLGLKMTLLELDGHENEQANAVLDLVTSAQETLGIANPVTTLETKAAREIAKTLLAFNQDDHVFEFDIEFITDTRIGAEASNEPLYLSEGHWVAIKREICPMFRCYGEFRDRAGGSWAESPAVVLGVIVDVAVAIPVTLVKVFSDTPDRASTKPIKESELSYDVGSRAPLLKDGKKQYRDKSWLSFSIYKGGDSSRWQLLKQLSKAEETLLEGISATRTRYQEAVDSLPDRVRTISMQLEAAAQRVEFLEPLSAEIAAGERATMTFRLRDLADIPILSAVVVTEDGSVYRKGGETLPVDIERTADSELATAAFNTPDQPGEYRLRLLWANQSGSTGTQTQPFTVRENGNNQR